MRLKLLRQPFVVRVFTILTLVAASNLLLAAKPGGGGGGGDTSVGTIYFAGNVGDAYLLQSMNADGSGKTLLPLNVLGTPSRLIHGGHRWFLASRRITDESYPNGFPRYERIALRDDGDESVTVQLTNDPELQFLGIAFWAPGETAEVGLFCGFARRWVFDGTEWVIDPDSVGIYAADVLFDATGNVIGLDAPPTMIASVGVIAGSRPGEWMPDASGSHFDWSPDLTQIVYTSTSSNYALVAQDVATGEVRTLTTGLGPYSARWSPAGNLIVFGNNQGSIETIAPDGSGRKAVVRWGPTYGYYWPDFSATGNHILYSRVPHGQIENDLFRATPSGSNKVNLTNGMAGWESSYGWR